MPLPLLVNWLFASGTFVGLGRDGRLYLRGRRAHVRAKDKRLFYEDVLDEHSAVDDDGVVGHGGVNGLLNRLEPLRDIERGGAGDGRGQGSDEAQEDAECLCHQWVESPLIS